MGGAVRLIPYHCGLPSPPRSSSTTSGPVSSLIRPRVLSRRCPHTGLPCHPYHPDALFLQFLIALLLPSRYPSTLQALIPARPENHNRMLIPHTLALHRRPLIRFPPCQDPNAYWSPPHQELKQFIPLLQSFMLSPPQVRHRLLVLHPDPPLIVLLKFLILSPLSRRLIRGGFPHMHGRRHRSRQVSPS